MFRRRRTAPFKYDEAYRMRYNPTPAEARMWEILKYQVMSKFPNVIFRRQQVRYGYILDFYCHTLRLAIEVDGGIHNEQKIYDRNRERHLARHGIDVRRIRNEDVFNYPKEIAQEICQIIQNKIAVPWYKKIFGYF